MTIPIKSQKLTETIQPDALTLAVMLATAELTNYSDEESLGQALENFLEGYKVFTENKLTPPKAHMAFRWLYCATDGELNDFVSNIISQFHPPYQLGKEREGILGNLSEESIRNIVEKIHEDGFYVFEQKLSPDICEKLKWFALVTPSNPYLPPASIPKGVYDRRNLRAPTYHFDEIDLLNNPEIQKIVTDSSILAVAQAYLGCKPIQDMVAMWWSTTFSKEADSAAAQLYHFDMDKIKFLKFFVYLTDVTPEKGPHCYVRGSRQSKPIPLLKDGRIPDSEIEQHYSKEQLIEIIGEAGTIFAADTRGFHKGLPLRAGERLMLQIEFANSLFGGPYNKFRINQINNSFSDFVSNFRYTYCRFF